MHKTSTKALRKTTVFAAALTAQLHRPIRMDLKMASTRTYVVSALYKAFVASLTQSQEAVTALNSLQTSFAVLEERRRAGLKMDDSAVHEMRQWLSRAGHTVCSILDPRKTLQS